MLNKNKCFISFFVVVFFAFTSDNFCSNGKYLKSREKVGEKKQIQKERAGQLLEEKNAFDEECNGVNPLCGHPQKHRTIKKCFAYLSSSLLTSNDVTVEKNEPFVNAIILFADSNSLKTKFSVLKQWDGTKAGANSKKLYSVRSWLQDGVLEKSELLLNELSKNKFCLLPTKIALNGSIQAQTNGYALILNLAREENARKYLLEYEDNLAKRLLAGE